MIATQFLLEWAIRSSILILSGALLMWVLRLFGTARAKDSAVRLAAWIVLLCASFTIPALTVVSPKLALPPVNLPGGVTRIIPAPVEAPVTGHAHAPELQGSVSQEISGVEKQRKRVSGAFNWAAAALTIYLLIALALLLRLGVGLAMSLRLLHNSRPTDRKTEGIEVRESDGVAAPVTLGILRPAIVLPADWREWQGAKLEAVLAHERSHIRRRDPAVQVLSAVHRALLWHSPLSWFLHRQIVRVAEEASDDVAVGVAGDRALYAEVLLDFMRRGVRTGPGWGVPMARYGRADNRIHRILEGPVFACGVTRGSLAAILILGSPLAFVVAAAAPQGAKQATVARQEIPGSSATPQRLDLPIVSQSTPPEPGFPSSPHAAPAARPQTAPVRLTGLGNVTAFYTVVIKPRVEGVLISVSFKEGDRVQAGQLLASIDPRPYQIQLDQAESQLARDKAKSIDATTEAGIHADQANIDNAKLQLAYTQIVAPITGVAGLRLVDPGNFVRPGDPILIITQLQPIAVLFTIPEDFLPQVRARLKDGTNVPVEAWNRDNSLKLATGSLTAVDNQIDVTTGTVKLKAVFDNNDDALFPNQFVNVRVRIR